MVNVILLGLFTIHYFVLRKLSLNGLVDRLLTLGFSCAYFFAVYIMSISYAYTLSLGFIIVLDLFFVLMLSLKWQFFEKNRYYIFYGLANAPFIGLLPFILTYINSMVK